MNEKETWGQMLAKWEADKPNHHALCYVQRGWYMSCQCDFIREIASAQLAAIAKAVGELLCGEDDGCVKDDGNHCSHINDALQVIEEAGK